MIKYEKAEKFKEEQEKALERSRALARKTAELRDAIRYLNNVILGTGKMI